MAVKELFNKAARGVKTLFKIDGLVQSTFNKASGILIKARQCLIKV